MTDSMLRTIPWMPPMHPHGANENELRQLKRYHMTLCDKRMPLAGNAYRVVMNNDQDPYEPTRSFIAVVVAFPQHVQINDLWLRHIWGLASPPDNSAQWVIRGIHIVPEKRLLFLGPRDDPHDREIADVWQKHNQPSALKQLYLGFPGFWPLRELPILPEI